MLWLLDTDGLGCRQPLLGRAGGACSTWNTSPAAGAHAGEVGGNFGRSRLRGQPVDCSSHRLPRCVSTWNIETGLVGIRLPGKGPARRSPITVLPPTVGLRALYRRIGGNSLHGASLLAEGPSF